MYIIKSNLGTIGPFKTYTQVKRWVKTVPDGIAAGFEVRVLLEPMPWPIFATTMNIPSQQPSSERELIPPSPKGSPTSK